MPNYNTHLAPPLPERLDTFMEVYARHLERAVRERPSEYAYGLERVPGIVGKFRMLITASCQKKYPGWMLDGSFAFKGACKEMGIRCTYTAIHAYLQGIDRKEG